MVLHLIYFENQCIFFFVCIEVKFHKKFNMTNEKISLLFLVFFSSLGLFANCSELDTIAIDVIEH